MSTHEPRAGPDYQDLKSDDAESDDGEGGSDEKEHILSTRWTYQAWTTKTVVQVWRVKVSLFFHPNISEIISREQQRKQLGERSKAYKLCEDNCGLNGLADLLLHKTRINISDDELENETSLYCLRIPRGVKGKEFIPEGVVELLINSDRSINQDSNDKTEQALEGRRFLNIYILKNPRLCGITLHRIAQLPTPAIAYELIVILFTGMIR